jgi:hypothetical protein
MRDAMEQMLRSMLDAMGMNQFDWQAQGGAAARDWKQYFPAPQVPGWQGAGAPPPVWGGMNNPAMWLDGYWLGENGMLLVFRHGLLRIYAGIEQYQDFYVSLRKNWLLLHDPVTGETSHLEIVHQLGWMGLRKDGGELALFRRVN